MRLNERKIYLLYDHLEPHDLTSNPVRLGDPKPKKDYPPLEIRVRSSSYLWPCFSVWGSPVLTMLSPKAHIKRLSIAS